MVSWTLVTLATLAINLAAAAPAPWDNDKNEIAAYSGSGGKAGGGSVQNIDYDSLLKYIFGGPLVNAWSGNAGDGGMADSGPASVSSEDLHGHGKFHQTGNRSAYSGTGGDAEGGSVTGEPAAVNLFSSNAGSAGSAKSGASSVLGRSVLQ